jgi:hypothetical protein
MTEYMLAPRNDNTPVRESLAAMLEANELVAYRVRANGTTRLLRLLPVSSTDREVAEWIYDQVEDGRTVQAVARETHSSTATVRRYLEALEITEQVEAGEWDAQWAGVNGFDYDEPVVDELTSAGITDTFLGEAAEAYPGAMVDEIMGDNWYGSLRPSAEEKAAGADAGALFS